VFYIGFKPLHAVLFPIYCMINAVLILLDSMGPTGRLPCFLFPLENKARVREYDGLSSAVERGNQQMSGSDLRICSRPAFVVELSSIFLLAARACFPAQPMLAPSLSHTSLKVCK
jgi:hypothetical protein